jgi:phage gpG-like protein
MSDDTKFVDGAAKLSRRIATIRERLALPVMIPQIGALLLKRTLDRFDREVTPDDLAWVPLADSTLKRRSYLGVGKKKLVNYGDLRASIAIIKGGAGTTFTNTGAGLRIGIDSNKVNREGVPLALIGSVLNRGNKHIPARQFLGIGRLDVKAVDSLLRRQGDKALEP